jgi:hypothetical protein
LAPETVPVDHHLVIKQECLIPILGKTDLAAFNLDVPAVVALLEERLTEAPSGNLITVGACEQSTAGGPMRFVSSLGALGAATPRALLLIADKLTADPSDTQNSLVFSIHLKQRFS